MTVFDKKKLLVLGCGGAQLDLIKESKKLGYLTIACDMRPEMEGAKIADKYYQVDYMDLEQVCTIAEEEDIDGIISNSEPAMVHVAHIAQRMNLIGNNAEAIETLVSKSQFRELQRKARVFAPDHYAVDSYSELLEKIQSIYFPVIIKPTISTGSQGTTRLDRFDVKMIEQTYNVCRLYSRTGQVSIEEYVPMNSSLVSESDVVVIGDDIIWDGMMWTRRSEKTPMLPETYICPMNLDEGKKSKIKAVVEKILKTAGIRHGQYNVEAYLTDNDEVFVIEINPRQGGNHIPQLIEQHTGVNLSKLLVSTSVGDMTYYNDLKTFKRENNFVTMHVVYARENGILEGIYISPEIKPHIKWTEQRIPNGVKISKGSTVFDGIACVDLQFDSFEEQKYFTDQIERFIYPIIQ